MRRFGRLAQSLTLALAFGLSLTACGDKEPSASSEDGGATSGAERASGGGALTQADFNERVFSAIEKAGTAKLHFETEAAGAGQAISGDGEVEYGDELAMRMTMSGPSGAGGGKQEVLLIGDTVYIGMGGQYMSMSMDAMSGKGMPDLSTNFDPRKQAEAFETAITGFEQKGEPETIDGVKATPYEITIDPTKAPDTFGTMVTEPLNFVYYVGPDDLPRKMVYKDKNGDFSATYTDWGDPVDIKKPPADKIAQVPTG
jgi:hypothetical protein